MQDEIDKQIHVNNPCESNQIYSSRFDIVVFSNAMAK